MIATYLAVSKLRSTKHDSCRKINIVKLELEAQIKIISQSIVKCVPTCSYN